MTPGELLKNAAASLDRNRHLLLAFIVAVCAMDVLVIVAELPFLDTLQEGRVPPLLRVYDLVLQLLHAGLYSALVAVVFARLGKDIDRPLWKCRGDFEALRHYFAPWLEISLLFLVLTQLLRLANTRGDENLQALAVLLFMMLYVVAVPIGACIMYHGGPRGAGFLESLAPLNTQILPLGPLFLMRLGGFLYLILLPVWVRSPLLRAATASLPISLLDALTFAATWRACMVHRDTPEDDDDSDIF